MIILVDKKRFASLLTLLLIGILGVCAIFNIGKIKKSFYPEKYVFYVEKYSAQYGLDKFMVYSIIKAESNFKEDVSSAKGAVGLMQVMPDTAEEIAGKIELNGYLPEKLAEPEINIQMGCYYLAFLLNRYSGDFVSAAAAYNAGYGNVDSWLAEWQADTVDAEKIPFGETKKYVIKVNDYYNKYCELYAEE